MLLLVLGVNERGFLCFLIVLAFSSLWLSLSRQDRALEELSDAMAIAIEAEKVNFVRSLLEENSDFIVRKVLEEEAASCKEPPNEIKEKINGVLLQYFEEVEKLPGEISIRFSQGKDVGFMNRNSSLIVKNLKGICTIKYSFHGGIMRNEFIMADISGKRFSQEFVLPAGYSQQIAGVVIG